MQEIRKGDTVRCINLQRKAYGKIGTVIETDGQYKALDWMKIRWNGKTRTVSAVTTEDFVKCVSARGRACGTRSTH